MESEDMLSALGWSREDKLRQSSRAANNAFPTLSPMVVMKNVLVKQVRGHGAHSLCTQASLGLPCACAPTPTLGHTHVA